MDPRPGESGGPSVVDDPTRLTVLTVDETHRVHATVPVVPARRNVLPPTDHVWSATSFRLASRSPRERTQHPTGPRSADMQHQPAHRPGWSIRKGATVMPAATVPKNALALGAGYLYYAALGSSLPAYTVVGSVFTDAWPGAWFLLGVTKNGHEMTYDLNTDTIDSAEYLDPLVYVTTGRTAGMK